MLANSGALRLSSDIRSEFGGATPVKTSDYYAGAASGYVRSGKANGAGTSLASSGAIKFSEFYGVFKSLVITYSTSGSYTATVPNGAGTLNAYSIAGSGGGGGGTWLPGKGAYAYSGGGGGSGGANVMLNKLVVASQTFSINVGTGGAAGANGGSGTGTAGSAGASSNLRGGIWGAVIPSAGGGGGGGGATSTSSGAGGTAGTGLTSGISGNTGGAGTGGYGVSVGSTEPTGPFIRAAGSGGSANGTGGGNGGVYLANSDSPQAGAVGLVVLVFR